jgi:hypothetical protein
MCITMLNQPLTRPAAADENAGGRTPSLQGRGRGYKTTVVILSEAKDLGSWFLSSMSRGELQRSFASLRMTGLCFSRTIKRQTLRVRRGIQFPHSLRLRLPHFARPNLFGGD